MATLLHILSRPETNLALTVIEEQKRDPGNQIEVFDLNVPEPDYRNLLEKIFKADSIEVW